MSIVATDVVTEFGAFYIKGSQNEKDLYKLMYNQTETAELFTTVQTQDTVIRKGDSRLTELLQPFQKAFTPKGTLTFKPVSIPLFKMKVDVQETPDDLEANWLGFLAELDTTDRKKWPFVRWFMEVHILRQMDRDKELNAIFKGIYAAPTPGIAGAANTSMDGFNKIRKNQISAGRVTPIALGALSSDEQTFCEQIETFARSMDQDVLAGNEPMTIAMSQTLARRYRRGKRKKYNMNYAQASDLMTVEDFDQIRVKGYDSMASSNVIFASPKWNLVRGQKRSSRQMQIENVDRTVKIYTDWWEGVGMIIPEYLFTNDQDLPS